MSKRAEATMAYYLIYETDTGKLVSQGTVLADPLRSGLTVVDVGSRPADTQMWDETTRTMVARPTPIVSDCLEGLTGNIAYSSLLLAWNALSSSEKAVVKEQFINC